MIQRIEELSMNAFPALSTMLINGWIVRFSKGYAKRANSVNPIYPCSVDLLQNIALCEELYKRQGLDVVFKLTESEAALQIDAILEQRGYVYDAKTNIMLRNIDGYSINEDERQNVVIYRELRDDWFDAYASFNKTRDKNVAILKTMLQNIITDTYYACIVKDGEIQAVGLGVAEQGYVGMFDICVKEELRRNGLGTKIMKNLMDCAAADGCQYTYLQVVDANTAAKLLYAKLEYEKQYSYWYRIKKQ